jgi:hypothetical protein
MDPVLCPQADSFLQLRGPIRDERDRIPPSRCPRPAVHYPAALCSRHESRAVLAYSSCLTQALGSGRGKATRNGPGQGSRGKRFDGSRACPPADGHPETMKQLVIPNEVRNLALVLPSPPWGRGWPAAGAFTSRSRPGEGVHIADELHPNGWAAGP